GFNFDVHRYGGRTDADSLRIESHEVAQMNRRHENDFVHRLGDELLWVLPPAFNPAGHVDVAQDHAAENRALGVCVSREHRQPDCWKSFAHDQSLTSKTDYTGVRAQ